MEALKSFTIQEPEHMTIEFCEDIVKQLMNANKVDTHTRIRFLKYRSAAGQSWIDAIYEFSLVEMKLGMFAKDDHFTPHAKKVLGAVFEDFHKVVIELIQWED